MQLQQGHESEIKFGTRLLRTSWQCRRLEISSTLQVTCVEFSTLCCSVASMHTRGIEFIEIYSLQDSFVPAKTSNSPFPQSILASFFSFLPTARSGRHAALRPVPSLTPYRLQPCCVHRGRTTSRCGAFVEAALVCAFEGFQAEKSVHDFAIQWDTAVELGMLEDVFPKLI